MDVICKKSVLTNGIRIVTEYMPHVRSVSFGAWFNFGSRDETLINNGISHFLEHMVFKGTENRNTAQIAESLESVGGNLNAFTSKEFTCYYAHVLDEHTGLAVDVISDLVSNALIDKDELEKEKKVVAEEIKSLDDTPDELIHEYFQRNIFGDHPLAFSILGNTETLANYSRNQLLDFQHERYTGNNLIISAAGNVDHEELVALVSEKFSLDAGEPVTRRNGFTQLPPRDEVFKKNISQSHICVGNIGVSYASPEKYTMLILHSVLGGGMSSRLFQTIREKHGVAYTIFSFADFYLDTGVFGVYIGVDRSNVDKSLELIRREFDAIVAEKVKPEELERFKSQLKGGLVLGLENTYSRMNRLAKMELYLNDYLSLDDVLNRIDDVTSDQVLGLADKMLSGKVFSTVINPAE